MAGSKTIVTLPVQINDNLILHLQHSGFAVYRDTPLSFRVMTTQAWV